MIKIEENQKSEAQIRLEEKLERDRAKLQEQVRKDHKKIEDLKRKAKSIIGEMFAEYLPDYYCFEGSELKEIVGTAMKQEVVSDKIAEIRSRTDADASDTNDELQNGEIELNDDSVGAPELSDDDTDGEVIEESEDYENDSDEPDGDDENDENEYGGSDDEES